MVWFVYIIANTLNKILTNNNNNNDNNKPLSSDIRTIHTTAKWLSLTNHLHTKNSEVRGDENLYGNILRFDTV
jgi:hypothetical protein